MTFQAATVFVRGVPSKRQQNAAPENTQKYPVFVTCVGVGWRNSLLTKGCFSSRSRLYWLLTCAASKLDGQLSLGDALTETFIENTGIVQNIKINIVSLQQIQTVTENAYIET